MSQQQMQILEICNAINEQLQIEDEMFDYNSLQEKDWYLKVLTIIFPYLSEKIDSTKKIKNDAQAIDAFLLLLSKQQIIEEDFLDIKGKNIVKGDPESIYYIVQLLSALIDRQIGQQQDEEHQQQQNSQQQMANASNQKIKNQNMQIEKLDSNRKSQEKNQQCHSVLGIDNEFEEKQSDEDHEKISQIKHSENQSKQYDFNNIVPNAKLINSIPQKQYDKTFEDEDGEYLNQKLKKYKSQPKLKKYVSPQKNKKLKTQKKPKKELISHPTIQKKYRKAKNPQAVKLTKDVKQNIKTIKKHYKKNDQIPYEKPIQTIQTIKKKNRQLEYHYKDYKKNAEIGLKNREKNANNYEKKQENIHHLLKWRQGMLAKQKLQFEKSMQMKLQNKREAYIKKINNFIIKMEKQKNLQEKREFQEQLLKENQQAARNMTTLEQWYQDKIHMLKDKKNKQRQQRQLMHTGHKEIIKQIEKDLKKENQEKIMKLTMKYRQQEAQIQDDLEELTSKIIQVYKKN